MGKKENVLSVMQEVRDLFKELIQRLPITATVKPVLCSKDGRFIRNSDGTVIDKQLNLIWYPVMEKKLTWEEAKKDCEKIGCRLPTTHELYSLVDVNKHAPAIDKDIFPDTKTDDWYWSGNTCAWNSSLAWCVDFSSGYVCYDDKGSNSYVRPVRSSQ